MLPGHKYSPEDLVRLLARRWWQIAGLVILGTAAAAGVSHKLVDKYRSETLIMVVPQRVPDSYVKSTVTSTIEERLPTINQQILSRSRLERIITDFGLYESLRRTEVMEDVVQRMRRDIDIPPIAKGDTSFRVSYISHDAKTAQKVAERLASLFIEENVRDRENLAEDTNQFLDSQLEDARRKLIESEKKLEEYRRQYSGQLPSQATTNLQAIQNTQLQLQSIADAMNREREHRLLVERQLVDLETPDPIVAATTAPAAPPDGTANDSPTQRLEAARSQLRLLETRLKPDHPDIRTLKRSIRELEAKEAAAPKGPGTAGETPRTPADILKERRIRELRAQIEQIDRDLRDKQAHEKELREVVASYQAKLDTVPKRESELVELTRDYETLQTSYKTLLTKRQEAGLAANLERRNIGEQFKVLDPARVPERPFSPNRALIFAGGAGGGLLLGIVLTAFLEYRDSSLKREADVLRLLNLPVLALVPAMASPGGVRSRRKWLLFGGLAAVFLLAASVAGFMLWRGRF